MRDEFIPKTTYGNVPFRELARIIRPEDKVILDVGCGVGANAEMLQGAGKLVHGVTLSADEASAASAYMSKVTVADIEDAELDYPDGFFDGILLSHALEHMADPWAVLRRLSRYLRESGRIYVILPNILFYKVRVGMAFGRLAYDSRGGILDRSHLRYFTYDAAGKLVLEAGYQIVSRFAIGSVPLWPIRRLVGENTWLDRLAVKWFPGLFGYHVIIVGAKNPGRLNVAA